MALPDPKDIKALFIDFDGTLVDSMPFLYSAYLDFLAQYNKEGSKVEFEELSGPVLRIVINRLIDRYKLPGESDGLFEEYMQILYDHYTQNLKLFSGARTFLNFIGELQIPLVLVTSATRRLAEAFLEAEGVDNSFSLLVTGDEETEGKPSPAIYKRALFLAEVSASEAIAIEDSPNGIAASTAAGIYTLQIIHQEGSTVIGIGDSAGSQVSSWHEMLDLFKAWYG